MQLLREEPSLAQDSRYQAIIYCDDMPAGMPEWLALLYGSFYGVLPALQALQNNTSTGLFTYVRRRLHTNAELPDLLLMFRRKNYKVRVLNEGMQLDPTHVNAFCNDVFHMMPEVMQIDFHAIAPLAPSPGQSTAPHEIRSSRPCLSWPCTEDIVISLPESTETYVRQLGKATRKSLKQHLARARRDLRGFDHQIIPGTAMSEELVRHIVRLNHARMSQLGRESAIDESATRQLISLVRSHGEAGVIMSETKLCAGTLACRIGDDVFSLVNAHDPAFDYLGLGNLCRHLMILQAINAGARRFHLMGGNLSAKRATLAIRQPLHHATVYRTRFAMIRDLKNIARHAGHACLFRLHYWMEDQQASVPQSRTGSLMRQLGHRLRRRGDRHQPSATSRLKTTVVAEEKGWR